MLSFTHIDNQTEGGGGGGALVMNKINDPEINTGKYINKLQQEFLGRQHYLL